MLQDIWGEITVLMVAVLIIYVCQTFPSGVASKMGFRIRIACKARSTILLPVQRRYSRKPTTVESPCSILMQSVSCVLFQPDPYRSWFQRKEHSQQDEPWNIEGTWHPHIIQKLKPFSYASMKHRNLCQEVLQIIIEPCSTQWKEAVGRFHALRMWMGGNLSALFV